MHTVSRDRQNAGIEAKMAESEAGQKKCEADADSWAKTG